ncbi:MAG: DeoR/GlpR transcriptional regulator, partial [Lactobacillus sp.]|nr:DeoR/GlpR transcriptional regulator [Lactobacillus sp.]
ENHYTSSLNSLKEIDQYEFDIAVIGTSSVNKNGVFVVNHSDAQIEREVVNRAKTVILLAEEYKFKEDRSSPYKVMNCDQADILITDNRLKTQYRKYFRKNIKIREVLVEDQKINEF